MILKFEIGQGMQDTCFSLNVKIGLLESISLMEEKGFVQGGTNLFEATV